MTAQLDPRTADSLPSSAATAPLLPLENGDRLTSVEFWRRYEAMPHVKKAELIEGIVYMGSPVSMERHARPDMTLNAMLFLFVAATPGTESGGNATVRLDGENIPQPDGLLRIDEARGGTSRIVDGYVVGPPELVTEITASRASHDFHVKRRVYLRSGVREYLVWRTRESLFDWFILREGEYVPLAAGADGITRSEAFPGLWLDVKALLSNDLPRVIAVVQQGLASPEHAAFVARLAGAGTSGA